MTIEEALAKIAELENLLNVANGKLAESEGLVASAVENARKEEKNKLYKELEGLKTELATQKELAQKEQNSSRESAEKIVELEKKIADKETEFATLTETNTKLTEELKSKGDNNMDEAALKTLIEESQKGLMDKIEEQAKELKALKEAKEADEKAKEIATYRNEKIASLDPAFHAFVKGSTKEELDAAYESAKAAHEQMLKRFGAPTPAPSVVNANKVLTEVSPEDISRMSKEEYAEFRKKLNLK